MADVSAEDLLGKTAAELQSDINIVGKSEITGSLKYVTGYTGFSGDVAEQSGHYIALHATHATADSIAVMLHGGTVGHPVTLDSDGLAIVRISDKDKQTIECIATKSGVTSSVTYSLRNLVLEPEA